MGDVGGNEGGVVWFEFMNFPINVQEGMTRQQHHTFFTVVRVKWNGRLGRELGDAVDEGRGAH
jgi:hypothetical protein